MSDFRTEIDENGKRVTTVDEYTCVATRLTLLANGNELSSATGFLWEEGGDIFLVSNWHVFSGRNCYTGQPMHSSGATPDEFVLFIHDRDTLGRSHTVSISILDVDGAPLWKQHPRGQSVDVAALRLKNFGNQFARYTLPKDNEAKDMDVGPGLDAFILGYPKGLMLQPYLPIWKRASIASEPGLPIADGEGNTQDPLPALLIDSASREGMSGSPVFARLYGAMPLVDGSYGMGNTFTKFIGIYSGRYGADDEVSSQLGRVWLPSTISEVTANRCQGTYELKG